MKKLVLAIGLVIASSVNIFGQDNALVSYSNKMFLETYNINAQNIIFSDSIPEITSYFTDKIDNRGNDESFFNNIDDELFKFTIHKIIGFKTIDVSEYSEVIKKIEIFKLNTSAIKFKDKQSTLNVIYFTYQDVHGKWYSSTWIDINSGYHF